MASATSTTPGGAGRASRSRFGWRRRIWRFLRALTRSWLRVSPRIQAAVHGETLSDRMRSVHAVPNLAKSLIVVARKAFRPLQQARLCCKDSFHNTDLLAVSERAAEVNLHASGRKPRLRRSSTTGFV